MSQSSAYSFSNPKLDKAGFSSLKLSQYNQLLWLNHIWITVMFLMITMWMHMVFCFFLCVHLISLFWRNQSGCHLEPGAKGPGVNELWLRELVSNESWQWLSGVTHNTTKLGCECGWKHQRTQNILSFLFEFHKHEERCICLRNLCERCLISSGLRLWCYSTTASVIVK